MRIVDAIGDRDIFLIPAIISCFVSPNQEQRNSSRIKCIKYAIRPSLMLDPKLAHVRMLRCGDSRGVWERQRRAPFFEQSDSALDILSLRLIQRVPPLLELRTHFDFPCHAGIIARHLYKCKGMFLVELRFVTHYIRAMKSRLKNITVTLEEKVARWVKREAGRTHTSVSRFLAEILKERMLTADSYERAMRRSLARKPFLKTDGRYLSREEVRFRSGPR